MVFSRPYSVLPMTNTTGLQWKVSRFFREGDNPAGVAPIYYVRKLHKNERNWTEGGICPKFPLDLPLF